ncbi:MAG: MFS transporter [Planctomycetota bacterium]|nr:MFS transporter [Planctomycetota bacterium]
MSSGTPTRRSWITRGVVGIVLATFFSDVAHEAATAVLPLYLASIGLGPAALGLVEGFADLVYSLAKLGGGVIGHRVERKRPIVAAGYALTMLGTSAMSLVSGAGAMMSLRAAAWVGRGVRSPMRDAMLADEVEPTHFGRAYGIERAADMCGALVGPLLAILLVWIGMSARSVIAWTIVPAAIPVVAILFMTRDKRVAPQSRTSTKRAPLPRDFKRFLVGVLLFGLGDFSRAFLILLAARALGDEGQSKPATLSIAVAMYALHNGVSALAAYPIGKWGDRTSKTRLLAWGYALGVATNVVLAFGSDSMPWLVVAVVMSGVYVAAEETLEKACGAQFLSRESRSLGLGVLGASNAVGDMISSVAIGLAIGAGRPEIGFLGAAVFGVLGASWMFRIAKSQPDVGV